MAARTICVGARGTAVVLLCWIGLIHVVQAPLYGRGAAYIVVLFILASAAAWLAALVIAAGLRGGWALGALVAAGTFTGLMLAATTGLPGFMDSFDAPMAMTALTAEGLFLALYLIVVTVRRDPLGV